jgi:AcrR family transcriptional regulator
MASPDDHVRSRRTGGRSARVRAAVLDATIEALLEHDIDALSIRDVARRAGVHETSIYRRWETKANLALDAVLSKLDELLPPPDTGSLRGDLVTLIAAGVAFARSPLGTACLHLAARRDLPEYDAAVRHVWAERRRIGEEILARAEARGELRPGLDYALTLDILTGPIGSRTLLTREPLDDTLAERIVDEVMKGIAARP